ncbi:MAG: HAD-IC family P-type ATPase [Actinomycetaceae bacterium]|nr:HAD-IC family P-type ATPase [Actinomycetaceae bacterium]
MSDVEERFAGLQGRTSAQAARAKEAGETNYVQRRSSRPVKLIIKSNIFTLFNAILTTAVVIVLIVGNWRDSVFGIVMVTNALIGIVSEIRAKHVLDNLAILEAPKSAVIRDGTEQTIASDDIIREDLVLLRSGDQVPADGKVLQSFALKIDESMLTGESIPVRKKDGDRVLSGTTVIAGEGVFVTEKIGAASYANQLTAQAKRFKKAQSEIADGINVILKWISWVILPVVLLLVFSQLRSDEGTNWQHAVVLAIAGVVGMIPQGLVLLTSMNFALAGAKLARQKVLIQELNAVEVLARVDRLCLDKTGTLTSGQIQPRAIIALEESKAKDGRAVLARLVAGGENETALATLKALDGEAPAEAHAFVPFDSIRKWSAAATKDGSWFYGAPEIITRGAVNAEQASSVVSEHAETGARVICLAYSPLAQLDEDDPQLPADLTAVLVVVLEEEIREDAASTLEYFRKQGVGIKVISGDNPATVGTIADRVGVNGGGPVKVMDAGDLPEDPEALADVMEEYDVFGRVTPEAKRAMVQALQSRGHTVAMTGDGVNDVLALKDSDLGIAMGSGARATRAVAKLVLIDGKFSKLPGVVAEGRRIIANMERVSALFLTKTSLSAILAVVVAIFFWRYPFLPRHLTIIGSLTIGIPAFFLALTPNHRRYKPGFLTRTLHIAVPSGIALAVSALVAQRLYADDSHQIASTVATLTVTASALYLLSVMSRPIVAYRAGILFTMLGIAVAVVLIPPAREFFALTWPSTTQWFTIIIIASITAMIIEGVYRYHQHKFGNVTRIVGTMDEAQD